MTIHDRAQPPAKIRRGIWPAAALMVLGMTWPDLWPALAAGGERAVLLLWPVVGW